MRNTPLNDEELQSLAKKRVDMKMGFLVHLTVFVLVNGGLSLLSLLGGGERWHFFPLWGWCLGLSIHGIVALLSLSGQGLRQRMMDRELQTLREQGLR